MVYFSKKRENVLVYLSNAIERYCKETGFSYDGRWEKWGPYGFEKNGIQRLEEYYPDALRKTYQGVSGYIYCAGSIEEADFDVRIPDAAVSSIPVDIESVEFVSDAYEAILQAEKDMRKCRKACGNGIKEPYGKNTKTLRTIRSTGTS